MACTWFGEIPSCCSLTVLLGPAWVLLKYVLQTIFSGPVNRPNICVDITYSYSGSFNINHVMLTFLLCNSVNPFLRSSVAFPPPFSHIRTCAAVHFARIGLNPRKQQSDNTCVLRGLMWMQKEMVFLNCKENSKKS